MRNVKCDKNDPNNAIIRNNTITEIYSESAIYLENCSVILELNEIRKNLC